MKVVVFPGVGDNEVRKSHEYFLGKIKEGLGCEGEVFVWEHGREYPPPTLPLKSTRRFVCEVLLDFQQVVVHALDMKVPEADIYIGHSAGSILALAQKKPCVIFGSPAALVEVVDDCNNNDDGSAILRSVMRGNTNNILNVINRYDLLSYPLGGANVENYEFTGPWYRPDTKIPITAHTHYWKCKKATDKIIQTIKSWQ